MCSRDNVYGKNSSTLEIPQLFSGQVVVAMVIVINSVIGGFD